MLSALSNYVWPKCDQPLDPISTLCSLTLRTMKCMKAAKPAVRENWLEFDRAGYTQSVTRYDASSNDLFYVNASLEFFRKNWSPTENAHLFLIVEAASRALKDLGEQYAKEHDNASIVCKENSRLLHEWLAARDAPPRLLLAKEDKDARVAAIEVLFAALKNPAVSETIEQLLSNWKARSLTTQEKQMKVASSELSLKTVKQKEAVDVLTQLVADLKVAPEDPEDKAAKIHVVENALQAIRQHENIDVLERLFAAWKTVPADPSSLPATKDEQAFASKCRGLWTDKDIEEFATKLPKINDNQEHLEGILRTKKKAFHMILKVEKFAFSIWEKSE